MPPPAAPVGASGPPAGLRFEDGPADYPPDYLRLVAAYGSGSFEASGEVGMVARLADPRSAADMAHRDQVIDVVRRFKAEEGDDYIPYDLYPHRPGLLPWASTDSRKHYFWLTDGEPSAWPVVVLYDIELFTRFDMPAVVFLERLLGGDLDCGFMGIVTDTGRLDPATISFVPALA